VDYTTLTPLLIVYRCSQFYCWRKLSYWWKKAISPNSLTNVITYVRELTYHIDDVMASMLASSVIDCGLRASVGSTKRFFKKMVFSASPLSTQLYGIRANAGWFEIRIMCPSGATCLLVDCCFSELAK